MRISLFFLSFLFSLCCLSQKNELATPEQDERNYKVIPIGQSGVVTLAKSEEPPFKKNKKWMISLYDNSFSIAWEKPLFVEAHYYIRGFYFNKSNLYILFGEFNTNKVKIALLDIASGSIESFDVSFIARFSINSFTTINKFIYLNGTYKNQAALASVNIEEKSFKLLESGFTGKSAIECIEVDTINNRTIVVFSNTIKKISTITIKTYQGSSLTGTVRLPVPGLENLVNGKLSVVNKDELIISGAYFITKGSNSPEGIYITKLDKTFTQIFIKFYPISELKNFMSYIPEEPKDDLENIEDKLLKKQNHGKERHIHFNLLLHEPLLLNGEYVIVAEVNFPTYRSESRMITTYVNSSPVNTMQTYSVFDGWLYTHSIVCGFDMQGGLTWENFFVMGDVKTTSQIPKIQVTHNDNRMTLSYSTSKSIKTEVIKNSQLLDTKEYINPSNENIKNPYFSNLEYWYDNYYIAYSLQKIKKQKNEASKEKPIEFFFNKITY